jgi:hypothetical protein
MYFTWKSTSCSEHAIIISSTLEPVIIFWVILIEVSHNCKWLTEIVILLVKHLVAIIDRWDKTNPWSL